MKRLLGCAVLTTLLATTAFAQGVGINGTGAAADTSAILDLSATNKGLLVPRMTAAQRAAIVLPATGLVVYQTDGTAGLYYNAGTSGAPNWQLTGANAVGGQWSTSGSHLYYTAGRVAVGTFPTAYRLTVQDTGSVLRVQADAANSVMASYGGFGKFFVDAPGVVGGRFAMLDNGYLGLGRVTPTARLDVYGGNFDVTNGEGDVRIGDGSYRMKFGVSQGGGNAGSATIMQHGAAGGYNVLALGAQGNKVAYINGNTQRLGIGNDIPTAPLGFAATLGKKISLYPALGSNDYGFGIASGRLQIFSDGTSGGDVAIGTDAAGTFTERFAVKNNGALAVNGNTGVAGQVLQSNGSGVPATWVTPAATQFFSIESPAMLTMAAYAQATLPDMQQTFTLTTTCRVTVNFSVMVQHPSCAFCIPAIAELRLYFDNGGERDWRITIRPDEEATMTGTFTRVLGPGTHTIALNAEPYTNSLRFGSSTVRYGNSMQITAIPQ